MAETESRDWSGLDCNLLAEIVSRIQLWEDFVSFAGICTSWRSEAADLQNNFRYKYSQIPWLMFPQKVSLAEEYHDDNLVIKFFSLSRGMSRLVNLPESANHTRYLSSRGWLIKISPDLSVCILHPFSRPLQLQQLWFPNLNNLVLENRIKSFPDMNRDLGIWDRNIAIYYYRCIRKCALSSSPPSNPPDSGSAPAVMMIIYGIRQRLAWARPGDLVWRGVKKCSGPIEDVIYCKDQFYAISHVGRIYAIKGKVGREVGQYPFQFSRLEDYFYLVESDGALLVVSRRGSKLRPATEEPGALIKKDYCYGTYEFVVLELDLSTSNLTPIKSLGTRSLFLGHNSSMSIDASTNSHCKSNCIYFTDDFPESYSNIYFKKQTRGEGGGADMGIYNMEDGNIERFFETNPCHILNPPMWVEHSFYL